MRIAPVGLCGLGDPFRIGCELAAITHGHPSGYLSAGFQAQLIADLVDGFDLAPAIDRCLERLSREQGHEETTDSVNQAVVLARSSQGTAEDVESLGQGWVGEEALAISLFCSLKAEDFAHGILLAVNHGGDSDSTGSITGNILGLIHSGEGIPGHWPDRLELREVIVGLAEELWLRFGAEV